MTDERSEAKRLAVAIAVGMLAAQIVGGPNDRFLAHLPFYATPRGAWPRSGGAHFVAKGCVERR